MKHKKNPKTLDWSVLGRSVWMQKFQIWKIMTTRNASSSHFETQKVTFMGRDPQMRLPGRDISHHYVIFGIAGLDGS